MKAVRKLCLLLLVACVGCADGGPVGTGISSSISGNVAAVDTTSGAMGSVAGVHVSVAGSPEVQTTTGADGGFALSGPFSGNVTLRFSAQQVTAISEPIDVPLGSEVVLDDVVIHPNEVEFVKPQLRRFVGRVAFTDCATDSADAAVILVNDRKVTANQFMVQLTLDSVLINGDGAPLPCEQVHDTDAIFIEGVILPDRTILAIAVVVTPAATVQAPPVREIRFRGTVAIASCAEDLVLLRDDVAGPQVLRLLPASTIVNADLQAITCEDIDAGARMEGKGLRAGRLDALQVVRAAVRTPMQP
jgi:hypothetical protein